ncbi:MAG: hypothetical protein ACTH4O_03255 [Lactococcus cremoris]
MSYKKQTWNKYDGLKTEKENIENGAVVTDNRMNHIEEGISSHTIDISNPHKVTAAQVGLGNIQNFGLATEDEAKQGISNAKYMTPSLTQAVLSANINSIAYANSADGTNGFTTVYPNLNLLDGTKDFSGVWWYHNEWETDGTYKGLTVKKRIWKWQGISKPFTAQKDGVYTFSAYVKGSGSTATINRFVNCWDINGNEKLLALNAFMGNSFDWLRDSFTVNLKTGDTLNPRYEISGDGTDSIVWTAGHKWEEGSTVTDSLTDNYPNLNLLEGSNSNDKSWLLGGNGIYTTQSVPFNSGYKFTFTYTRASTDYGVYMFSGLQKDKFKPDTDYVLSFMANVSTDIKPDILFANAQAQHNFVIQLNKPTILSSNGDQKVVIQLRTSSSIPSESEQQLYIGNFFNKVGTFSIWDLKIEEGSTVTPWMPSKNELQEQLTPWMPSLSEVTTADWPKYVGFSNTVKTNKSARDYTWFPVKDSELTNKVESHINNKANPHAVTASQVGAYSKQEIDTKLSKAVMADDSGKVTVSNTIDSGQVKTATINTGYGRSAVITRIGNTVTITSQNLYTIAPANGTWLRNVATLPSGYCPVEDVLIYNHDLSNGSKFSWSLLHPSGVIDLFSSGNISTTDYILTSGQFWITKDDFPN